MSIFNYIYLFDELPKHVQKIEAERLKIFVENQAKLMRIDTQKNPHYLKDSLELYKRTNKYCDSGFGRYFRIEMKQIIKT